METNLQLSCGHQRKCSVWIWMITTNLSLSLSRISGRTLQISIWIWFLYNIFYFLLRFMENGKTIKKKKELVNSGASSKKQQNPMWHLYQLETVIKLCPEEVGWQIHVHWRYTTVPNLQARWYLYRMQGNSSVETQREKCLLASIAALFHCCCCWFLSYLQSPPPQPFNLMDTRCSFAFTYFASTLTGAFFSLRSYGNDPISFISCEFKDASATGGKSGL